jgi:hypothetical protein
MRRTFFAGMFNMYIICIYVCIYICLWTLKEFFVTNQQNTHTHIYIYTRYNTHVIWCGFCWCFWVGCPYWKLRWYGVWMQWGWKMLKDGSIAGFPGDMFGSLDFVRIRTVNMGLADGRVPGDSVEVAGQTLPATGRMLSTLTGSCGLRSGGASENGWTWLIIDN